VTWRQRIAILLGVAAYTATTAIVPSLGDPEVERQRALFGGSLQPVVWSQTRWYLADHETAIAQADAGILGPAARLWRAAQSDGVLKGVLSTRTSGLVRLPKRFRGRADIVSALEQGSQSARSIFDEMNPASELALIASDGIGLGVGVGEYIQVEGRDYPVLVRLDPEFLRFRWSENRWYFQSVAGELAITPGDGRWVLHTPGGRVAPWQFGLWRAVGKSWIRKEHAQLHKDNWESKLANPARVAIAPNGATETQKQSWFTKVMAWGVNTVFGLTPGYDVKILESNGRGYESFLKTIADQNTEIIISVAGQTVTVDGGTGFANADIHKSIRADLIKETADALAFTINTQGLPAFIVARFGEDALIDGATVEWDVAPPKDRTAENTAAATAASAITALTTALAPYGLEPDVEAICVRAGVPVRKVQKAVAASSANAEPKSNVVPIRGVA
jgi:hypothetical protein